MKLLSFFKLSNWKRMTILGVTFVTSILAIVLGSIFYVGKDAKKSIEYGGGQEYVVKVVSDQDNPDLAVEVADSIYERIDALGVGGAEIETGNDGTASTVRIQYPGLTSESQKQEMEKLIVDKPHLIFTDVYGNPLFDKNGHFLSALRRVSDPQRAIVNPTTLSQSRTDKDGNPIGYQQASHVPLAPGKARAIPSKNGGFEVEITLDSDKSGLEWLAATSYISRLPKGKNQIVAWLDLDSFIEKGRNWTSLWNNDPVTFAHVGNNVANPLRSETIDAGRFLISSASVKAPMSGRVFTIEGNFNQDQAKALARKLNYGSANYQLKTIYSNSIQATYGHNAFNKAMIAGIIVFSLIALFLMVNYGLLGFLSTISIALYMFMTLLLFTVMRGQYSPETIAALIIGVGMSVDANIITFERMKAEVYSGTNIIKSHKKGNKNSFSAILDANVTTMIIAFVLFYFGTRNIVGLSITLIISIFFTLLIMLIFTRMMSTLLINTGYFEKRRWMLGIRPKFDKKLQSQLDKPDYVKHSKYFGIASIVIIVAGFIVFGVMAGINGSILSGMNFSKEFTGGTDIMIASADKTAFTAKELSSIKTALMQNGVHLSDISQTGTGANITKITVNTTDILNATNIKSALANIPDLSVHRHGFDVSINMISNDTAREMVKNAALAIAISIGGVILYTLIRFKWTYSFSAIIALVHDALIVVSAFMITRISVSPVFVAGLLTIIGYSINDTIVTFDRIREKVGAHVGQLDAQKIKKIGNDAVKDTVKRSLFTSLTTITAIVVLMSFGNATKLSFNLAMLVGLAVGTYSSIYIATYIWVKLETIRQRKIQKRAKSGFWKVSKIEEQTFDGINDYVS